MTLSIKLFLNIIIIGGTSKKGKTLTPPPKTNKLIARYGLSFFADIIDAIKKKLDVLTNQTNKAKAYYTLGDLCRENRQLAEAGTYYRKAIELKPNHAPLHNDLAVVLHYQGKLAEAVSQYDKALKLNPDLQAARNNRQKAIMQLKN